MLDNYGIRTDLALEATERFTEENVEVRGVEVHEDYNEEKDIRTTVVKITTENGARTMGRPQGSYITIEAPGLSVHDEDYHREISLEIARHLQNVINLERELSILVVGLGNSAITADSLGPHVVENLHITRHMIREYGLQSLGKEKMHRISGIIPGVMAQTGMETSEIIQGIVAETKPDIVIAIDALAARSTPEPYDPDHRHRNQPGFRCRQSQSGAYRGKSAGKSDRDRSTHRSRCGNYRP